MRLEAPRFFNKSPSAWISQMQRYFDYYNTPDQRRLIIVSFYLDGDVLYWYDWMQKYHLLSSWNEFCWQLRNGLICQIVMTHEASLENFNLMPTGSLAESHHLFDQLSDNVIEDPMLVEPSCVAAELRSASRSKIQQKTLVDKFDSLKLPMKQPVLKLQISKNVKGLRK